MIPVSALCFYGTWSMSQELHVKYLRVCHVKYVLDRVNRRYGYMYVVDMETAMKIAVLFVR
jgi:hypothetical protein